MKLAFHKNYFIAAVFLFLVEVFIAVFIKDRFVRPYGGDFLVVILIYCFIKSFWNGSPFRVCLYVLLFAFLVEVGQHFQLATLLGLNHSELARVVIGTGFDWGDLLAYTLGVLTVLVVEKYICRLPNSNDLENAP